MPAAILLIVLGVWVLTQALAGGLARRLMNLAPGAAERAAAGRGGGFTGTTETTGTGAGGGGGGAW